MKEVFTDKRANDIVSGGGNSVFASVAGEGPGAELAGGDQPAPKPTTTSEPPTGEPPTQKGDAESETAAGKPLTEYRHNL